MNGLAYMHGDPLSGHPQDASIYPIIQLWDVLLCPKTLLWYTLISFIWV